MMRIVIFVVGNKEFKCTNRFNRRALEASIDAHWNLNAVRSLNGDLQ